MPNLTLTNVSAYATLTSDLEQLILSLEDDLSVQLLPNFIDVSNKVSKVYAKRFVNGVFLINETLEDYSETNAFKCTYKCFIVYQNVKSFDATFNQVLGTLQKQFNTTTEISDITGEPLMQKFKVVDINRNTELPEKIMDVNEANPYWVASITIDGLKLGY